MIVISGFALHIVPLQCLRLPQLGVVNLCMNNNSCNALIILQDCGYLRRNIKNTSTRETVSVHFTFTFPPEPRLLLEKMVSIALRDQLIKSIIFLGHNLQLDGCTVTSSTVNNLGVILDSNLSFENHVSHVTKTAFFHLRNIAKLRKMLSVSDAEKLVHAFMTARLDYCNALLGGRPASSINKLQIVQNAAARILTRSRKYDHITQILQSLHWLPIKFRISYKILLLAYKALNDLAPAYLTNLLSRYIPTRSLRSRNSGLLLVPRIARSTKGGITFSYLAPKWNSLSDNVRGSDTLSLFKSRSKTHLFSQAFI